MKFGIVGFGRFGKLMADALKPYGTVQVCDKNFVTTTPPAGIYPVTLAEVAEADIVFLFTPISELAICCQQIKDYLRPETLVVDGCSVKVYPLEVLAQHLPANQSFIGTHPLFGPDSVHHSGGLAGHKIVICEGRCSQEKKLQLEELFKKMGLQVLHASAEEHDQQMANSQGLVHFIGRGLGALDLHPQELATPDFQALVKINKMVVNDSWRLFLDMHQYNSYAKAIRQKFIHQLLQIEKAIDHATKT